MAEYLVCILSSSNIESLKITYESAYNQEKFHDFHINIILNTLDENYYNEVINYFKLNNKLTKILKTESNGKPGKGHNSVINHFKNSFKYDKLIIIDGDDYFYPDSIYKINLLYEKNNYDVITLAGNTIITNSEFQTKSKNNKYSLEYTFDINEMTVSDISTDYNKILATPFRLISLNRQILNLYEKLYDEDCLTYDDYLTFLIIYKEYFLKNLNILILSCDSMYMYTKFNNSFKATSSLTESLLKVENEICRKNATKLNINMDNLECEKIKIIPFHLIISNYENKISNNFYLNVLSQSIKTFNPIYCKKNILFIDTTEWNYYTIDNKPVGGTQSAIYYLSNKLSEKDNVLVLTTSNSHLKISDNLSYNFINEQNIISFNPDYVIFQGLMYNSFEFYKNLNPKVKLINWNQHDINVQFVKNTFSKELFFDKYIFVSNWQKNRYIQNYNLDHSKCYVMQNAISNNIPLNYDYMNSKEPTITFMSLPYRGLLIAFELFQIIKKEIPNIKFKIFSSFSRDFNTTYSKKIFNPMTIDDLNNLDNEFDKYYLPLYKQLVSDKNIEFYGSVPQKILFKHLESSMIFFYPNTFLETCCTSILEAMAFKCNVITSNIGALPETCNGFASLFDPLIDFSFYDENIINYLHSPIQIDKISENYINKFVEKTISLIKNYYSINNKNSLNHQINYIKSKCIWDKKINDFLNILND